MHSVWLLHNLRAGVPAYARDVRQAAETLSRRGISVELAQTDDTLVFYMSAKNITDLTELLLRYSKKPNTPLAVIEQATTEFQQVHLTTLNDALVDFAGKNFSSPSLVIIGEVARLHEQFNWFNKEEKTGSIFKELLTQ